jgi:translation elongation factor EF-1alpha
VSIAIGDVDIKGLRRSVAKGAVLARPEQPATVAMAIRANLIFFDREVVYSDKEFQLHVHGQRVPCRIAALERESVIGNPALMFSGEEVRADVNLEKPVSIEPVSHLPRMARFVLRLDYRIVACGVCLETRNTPFARSIFRSPEDKVAGTVGA